MIMLADEESRLYHARNAIRRWIVGRVWLDAFELELIDCPRRSSEAEAEDDDVEPWPQAPRAPHFPRILRMA